jgi:aquaporin Z
MNIRALVAEMLGTFILVFVGSLGVWAYAIASSSQGDPLTALLMIPFAFGLGLMAAIAIAGPASGGHFNPAVTLAALFDGRVDWRNAAGYAVAQLFGALAASLMLRVLSSIDVVAATVNHPGPTAEALFDKELHAFVVEAILTTIFVAVILTVTKKAPGQAIIVIPLTLVVIHFVGIFISGASVNPVRSLAPAIVSGSYESLWVYLTAPFLGSIAGWGIYRFLNPPDEENDEADEDDDFGELDDLEDDD